MNAHVWLVLSWLAFIVAAVSVVVAPAFGRLTWHFWVAVGIVLYLAPQVLS